MRSSDGDAIWVDRLFLCHRCDPVLDRAGRSPPIGAGTVAHPGDGAGWAVSCPPAFLISRLAGVTRATIAALAGMGLLASLAAVISAKTHATPVWSSEDRQRWETM
jgi:hypothetical protein